MAGRTFHFQRAEVEAILALIHNISDEGRGALRARMRHLQRLSFPHGVNTGRGTPARYGLAPVFHLALAFELIQLGISPERCVDLLNEGLPLIVKAGVHVFSSVLIPTYTGGELLLMIDPRALATLQRADQSEADRLTVGSIDDLGEYFSRGAGGVQSRMAVISLKGVIASIVLAGQRLGYGTHDELLLGFDGMAQ